LSKFIFVSTHNDCKHTKYEKFAEFCEDVAKQLQSKFTSETEFEQAPGLDRIFALSLKDVKMSVVDDDDSDEEVRAAKAA